MLPSGVRRVPGLSLALAMLLVGVHVNTAARQAGSEPRLEAALGAFAAVRRAHPEARVGGTLLSEAPPTVRSAVADLVRTDGMVAERGDGELDGATDELMQAALHMPQYQDGYRAGRPSLRTAVLSPICHRHVGSLIANLLGLLLLGALLEWRAGPTAVVVVFVLGAAGGLAAHHVADPSSLVPLLGASGAVSALLGALAGGATGRWRGPLWGVTGLVVVLSVSAAALGLAPGISHTAHMGGLAVGLLFSRFRPTRGGASGQCTRDSAVLPAAGDRGPG